MQHARREKSWSDGFNTEDLVNLTVRKQLLEKLMTTNVAEGMMSVEEFGKLKGIAAEKVVEMIRDGFYVGQKVDDDWFIDKSELNGENSKESVNTSVVSDIDNSNASIFFRFGMGIVSFIVGLSAFFIFKLVFMIPLNLVAMQTTDESSYDLFKSIGAILVVLAIYLAVKYTKKLNSNGTRKSRNIKRAITIVAGLISMLLTTVFSVFANLPQ